MDAKKYMVLAGALLVFSLPLPAGAEDSLGIGADDYIIDGTDPDLLKKSGENGVVGEVVVYDPLEPMNRAFFEFNDKLYFWVLKPVKQVYTTVVPWDFRFIIGNFFNNLSSPVDFVNTLLQGRFSDAGAVLGRFVINSTIGVFGFGDAAKESFDIQPVNADFGQTLGVYGLGDGLYLNWPFFGPSNVRDSVGLFTDMQLHPYNFLDMNSEEVLMARGFEFVNRMSITPETYEEIKRISLDPYVATRQAYTEYRRNFISSQK